MQYLLLLYADEAGWSRMSEAQQRQGYAAYMAYTAALKEAGLRGQQSPAACFHRDYRAARR